MSKAEISVLYPCGTAIRARVWSFFGKAEIKTDDTPGGCPLHGVWCKPSKTEAERGP